MRFGVGTLCWARSQLEVHMSLRTSDAVHSVGRRSVLTTPTPGLTAMPCIPWGEVSPNSSSESIRPRCRVSRGAASPEAFAAPELRLGLRRWRIGFPMRSWFTHRRVGLVRARLDMPFVVQYLGVVAVEHLGNPGRDAVSMVPCDRWSPDCGTIVRIACESLAIHVEQDQAGCGRILPSEKVELRSRLRSMRG